MKQIVSLLIAMLSFILVEAQQEAEFSHYMFNQLAINPGYAGTQTDINVTAINRQQWVGFDGRPTTTSFTLSAPLKLFNIKSGVGLTLINDQIGFYKNFEADLDYAFRKKVRTGELGLGINFGVVNETLDASNFKPAEGGSTLDLPTKDEGKMVFDLGIGAFYKTEDYYLGVSITHINQSTVQYSEGAPTYVKRNYYIEGGYNFQLPIPLFELNPSILYYTDGVISQFCVNGLVLYNKKVWAGVSYRLNDLVGMFGVELRNGIKIGYSYDYTMSAINKSSSGTHEIMLNYGFELSVDKTPQKFRSVRFL